jgi:hypothetical protein
VRQYRLWPRGDQKGPNGYPPAAVRYRAQVGAPSPYRPQLGLVAAPRRRSHGAVRRRRVLVVLGLALVVPSVAGVLTGAAAAWWAVAALLPFACAYVAVVMHTRRRTAEREINIAFFGRASRTEASLEEVFTGELEQVPPRLRAVGGGRDW